MENILLIRSNINPGGPASLIKATIEELIKRDYKVFVACGGGSAVQSIIDAGAEVQIFDELSFERRNILGSIRLLPRIRKYIKLHNVDTIYGFNSAASLVAYIATLGRHKKIKIGNALLGMRKERLHKLMPFKHACMSGAQKDYLIKSGLKEDRITVLYPSTLDLGRFNPEKYDRDKIREQLGIPKGKAAIGNVMNGKKGRADFPELVKKVCDRNDNAYWVFVGNTEKYELYKKELNYKQYADKYVFLGLRNDIPGIMYALDILSHYVLLESDNMETFGMVLTEAMSMYTPVVTNNYGGMVEIVENSKSGYLVNDDDEYVDCMTRLCESTELRKSMGVVSRKRSVSLFSKDIYGTSLEEFLKNL